MELRSVQAKRQVLHPNIPTGKFPVSQEASQAIPPPQQQQKKISFREGCRFYGENCNLNLQSNRCILLTKYTYHPVTRTALAVHH